MSSEASRQIILFASNAFRNVDRSAKHYNGAVNTTWRDVRSATLRKMQVYYRTRLLTPERVSRDYVFLTGLTFQRTLEQNSYILVRL